MFSRNMYDSVARYNIVSNEERGIVISESHNNTIYDNTVSDSGSGIDVDNESYENIIHNNIIKNIPNPSDALSVEEEEAEQNTLYSNTLVNPGVQRINLDDQHKQEEEGEEER
jgi:parallel beta-helix repeat protein